MVLEWFNQIMSYVLMANLICTQIAGKSLFGKLYSLIFQNFTPSLNNYALSPLQIFVVHLKLLLGLLTITCHHRIVLQEYLVPKLAQWTAFVLLAFVIVMSSEQIHQDGRIHHNLFGIFTQPACNLNKKVAFWYFCHLFRANNPNCNTVVKMSSSALAALSKTTSNWKL